MVASVLKGESKELPSKEERDAFAASINTKEAAKAGLDASIGALTAAIQSVDGDGWLTKVMAPWGMEVTKAHMCSWAALHIMYHDGQLNFVQVLNGDTEVHWM